LKRVARITEVRTALTAFAFLGLGAFGCAVPATVRTGSGTGSGSGGHEVLDKAREMIGRKVIVVGGCWDYINAVYDRTGYPENKRSSVFKTERSGPYADLDLLEPGDWIYFVNHSYGDMEHSGIFVNWTNKITRRARMISYAGENRREPARYMTYDLRSVYSIMRPGR